MLRVYGLFIRNVFQAMSVIITVIKCVLFISIRIMDRICPSPILSIIHTVTIGTMLNFNGCNNGHGVKNVTCKQTFTVIKFNLTSTRYVDHAFNCS